MPDAERNRVGETIERYRLEERIGSGGFGAVYRARHTLMDRPACPHVPPSARLQQRRKS